METNSKNVIKIVLGGEKYACAALSISECRRIADIVAEIRRGGLAGGLHAIMDGFDAALELIFSAMCRAGYTGSLEDLRDISLTAEIGDAMIALMATSMQWHETPPGAKVN